MSKSKTIRIFCFAEGRPGDWEAICPTFDLAAQGESFDEVRQVLSEMIADYIVAISELPEDERERFLHRKAPLWVRLKIYLRMAQAVYGIQQRKLIASFDFDDAERCPA